MNLNQFGYTSKFKSIKTLKFNTCVGSAGFRHLILSTKPLSRRLVLLPHLLQSPGVFFVPQTLQLSSFSLQLLLNPCPPSARLRDPHSNDNLGCRRPTGY